MRSGIITAPLKKTTAFILLVALMHIPAWGDSKFKEKAEAIFSPSVIYSIKADGDSGEIVFKTPENMPYYFVTGDKANKVFAIDSARMLRDLPDFSRLKLKIPLNNKTYSIDVSREEIERFYGIDLSSMSSSQDIWRSEFIQKFDNKKSRSDFAERFVTQEK